jgi:hypothetical protein
MSSRRLVGPQASDPLKQRQYDKFGRNDQISLPQSPWFLNEAIKPFEAALLHPKGCTLDSASVKVKGGANADHHCIGQ